jgi:hypothetical protein
MKRLFSVLLVGLTALSLASCTGGEGTDTERKATNATVSRIAKSVGFPNTSNALVKKLLRLTYELTDRGVDTHIYFRMLDGELRYVCPGYGYPSAYSTQYSRPFEAHRMNAGYSEYDTFYLPQAEPDGTYKPDSHSGTYYLCKGKAGIYLEYEEGNVSASSALKKTISSDEFVGAGKPILTYEELEKMKKLSGAELDALLKEIAARVEARLGQ